jgi:hypothetical protein
VLDDRIDRHAKPGQHDGEVIRAALAKPPLSYGRKLPIGTVITDRVDTSTTSEEDLVRKERLAIG